MDPDWDKILFFLKGPDPVIYFSKVGSGFSCGLYPDPVQVEYIIRPEISQSVTSGSTFIFRQYETYSVNMHYCCCKKIIIIIIAQLFREPLCHILYNLSHKYFKVIVKKVFF